MPTIYRDFRECRLSGRQRSKLLGSFVPLNMKASIVVMAKASCMITECTHFGVKFYLQMRCKNVKNLLSLSFTILHT